MKQVKTIILSIVTQSRGRESNFFSTVVGILIICLDWAISVKFHLPCFGKLFSGGVVLEYSIDERDRPKSLALRGRGDASSSPEIQKILDRLIQAGEKMILVDFAGVN